MKRERGEVGGVAARFIAPGVGKAPSENTWFASSIANVVASLVGARLQGGRLYAINPRDPATHTLGQKHGSDHQSHADGSKQQDAQSTGARPTVASLFRADSRTRLASCYRGRRRPR